MRYVHIAAAGLLALVATPALAQLQGPCFFMEPDFKGDPMCIAPMQRLPSLGEAVKNKLMSVQIPPGVRVTICEGDNLGGSCQTLSQSVPNFTTIGAAGRVGSLVSESAGAPRATAPPQQPPGPPPQQQSQFQQPPQQQPPQQQGGLRPGPGAAPPPPAPPPSAPRPQQSANNPYQPVPPAPPPAPPPPPAVAPPPPPPAVTAAPPPPPPRPPQQANVAPPAPNAGPPAQEPSINDETTRELRRQLVALLRDCNAGDKAACVRMGFIIGGNRTRREAWRHDVPELFFWDN